MWTQMVEAFCVVTPHACRQGLHFGALCGEVQNSGGGVGEARRPQDGFGV